MSIPPERREMIHDWANANRRAGKRWLREGHPKRAKRHLLWAAGWYWYLSERCPPRTAKRRRFMWLCLGCQLRADQIKEVTTHAD